MKKVRKSLAIIFALAMLFTNGTVQCAFAGNNDGNSNSGNNGTNTAAVKSTDPYVYLHNDPYLYQYRSSHRYGYGENANDNSYKNGSYAPAIYRLINTTTNNRVNGKINPDDDSSASLGYCCDLVTGVEAGTKYKRLNLEDAGYYGEDAAKHIRLILNYGFWKGIGSKANVSMADLAANVIKYEEAKGQANPAALSITPAEALAATQYAVWHFSNQDTLVNQYTGTGASNAANMATIKDMTSVNPAESAKSTTKSNIDRIYKYLINLDPNDKDLAAKASPVSIIWGFEQSSDIQLIPETTNDEVTYDTIVKFKLTGSSDETSGLTLSADAVMKSGSANVKAIDSKSILLSELAKSKDSDGYYSVTFEDLTADQIEAIERINLSLDGTQEVKDDVYFYESEKVYDKTKNKEVFKGQCFVGLGNGETAVHQEYSVDIKVTDTESPDGNNDGNITKKTVELIKYDEDSAIEAKDANHAKELEAAGMVKVSDKSNGTFAKYVFTVADAKFQLYAKVDGSDEEILVGEPITTNKDGKASWTVLASGDDVTYYYKEIEAPKGYKLPDGNVTYDLSSSEARKWIPNCHDTGSIIISKTVEGNADSNIDTTQHFNFKVEVDFSEATLVKECKKSEIDKDITHYSTVWSGTTEKCEKASHTNLAWVQDTDKEGKTTDKWTTNITLAHGESLAINDLPVGTKCTVTELDADGNAITDSSKPFVYNDILYVTADAVQSINVQSGEYALDDKATTDDESNNVIGFVNTKYAEQGEITLTKEFIGKAADGTYYFKLFNEDSQVTGAFHGRQMIREIKVENGQVNNEEAVFTGVPFGEYTIYEVDAEGNKLKSDTDDNGDGNIVTLNGTKYVVNGEGAVSVSQNSPNAALTITNTSLTITKTDITGSDEVVGAELKITEKSDGTSEEWKVIDEWTSTEESHVVKGELEKGKTYVISEVTAPEGYAYITTDIEFTIDNDGKIQIIGENKNAELSKDTAGNTTGILVKDDAISFTVNKTDLDGNELAGSEITIFKYNNETGETGAVVDTWSSKVGETYDLGSKLTAGETYLLRETNAPDGYGYIDDVIFTVAKDGSIEFIKNSLPTMKSEADDGVQVMGLDNEVSNITNNNSNDNIYLVKDGQTEITVKKLDQNNNPVVGAKLAILDKNKEPVLTNDGTAIEWTTDGKDKDITGLLIAGETYILTELEAPEGYQKAEDIEFTVPELNGEAETVTMTDVKFGMGGVDKDGNGNNSDNDNSISTGDRTNMGLCLMLMTAAMVAGLGALTFRRKA